MDSFRSSGRAAGWPSTAQLGNATHRVDIVNLCAGGAMIRGSFEPRLGDRIDLALDTGGSVRGVVRRLRGDRIGLELADAALPSSPWDLPPR